MISNYLFSLFVIIGAYLGYIKHIKYRQWVPQITEVQVNEAINSASDPADLAKRLFILVFKEELEFKASSVCCTKNIQSRELLNLDYLLGIRCMLTISITSCLMHIYCRKCDLDLQFRQPCNIK